MIDLMFNSILAGHQFSKPIQNLLERRTIFSFPVNPFAIHLESFIFGDSNAAPTQRKFISSLREWLTNHHFTFAYHISNYQVPGVCISKEKKKKSMSQPSICNWMNPPRSQWNISIWRFLIGIQRHVNSLIIAAL